jgi:hypothetical protein
MSHDERSMTPVLRSRRAALLALATACALSTQGCGFAVKHPAVTAGIAAGALGFTTCKLASDSWASCGYVGGGAAAFLGLVTAAALWLGGDGDSTGLDDEPLPPLLEEGPPSSANEPPANPPSNPPSANPPSANPPSANPPSANPPPTIPPSATPPPTNPPSANPSPTNPPSANPD